MEFAVSVATLRCILHNPMQFYFLHYICSGRYEMNAVKDAQGVWRFAEFRNESWLLYLVLTLEQVSGRIFYTEGLNLQLRKLVLV